MGDQTLARYADLLRNDFVAFAHRAHMELSPAKPFEPNWHIDLISEKLEAVRTGKINRLIVNIPPRSLKSFLGTTVFPAFVLGHNPSAEILCTTYNQDVANDQALPCRSLMLSPFYEALFKTRLSDDRQAVEEFKTTAGGARRAISWTGALLGRGADIIIVDDPLKPEEANSEARRTAVNEAFHSSVATRLNKESGAIVLIMQRLHANDLTAFVQKTERWEVLALPALAVHDEVREIRTPYGRRTIRRVQGQALQPKRQSASFLKDKREGGARTFDAQYQQKPHSAEGAIVQREWLTYYDDNTKPAEFAAVIQSWDTAGKPGETNSYSVCTTWGIRENRFYLLDVLRERLGFRELKLTAISLAKSRKDLTTVLVEEQSSGSPLIAELQAKGFPVQPVPSGSASKAERLYARSNVFESGRVLLPNKAPWLTVYIDELTSFPDSDFSDQVDSTSQALAWDTSSTSFSNAIRAMELLNGRTIFGAEPKKMIKLLVLEGGGQIYPGDGQPVINVPQTGEVLEVEHALGASLVQAQWKKYQIIPD